MTHVPIKNWTASNHDII